MIESLKKSLRSVDWLGVFIMLIIVLMSMFLIYEIDSRLSIKQLIYICLTLFVSLIIFFVNIKRIFWLVPLFYWGSIALLIITMILGMEKYGAQRWLEIPFIGMTIQPSEIVKVALILMLAYNINKNPPPETGYDIKEFLKYSFLILLPTILVKLQPDLGTSILIFVLGYGILFLIGIQKKIILCALAAVPFIAVFLFITSMASDHLHGYQLDRINQFLDDKPQYQVRQAMISIGSAGLFGKDKDDSKQSQLKFLPVPESDFIFPYFMERFGFVGACVLIALYTLLILNLFSLSYEHKHDKILQVICASIGLLVFFHFSINIAMTIKLAPVVGIPIPFFSYGGSSFLAFGILFALEQNLLAFKHRFSV